MCSVSSALLVQEQSRYLGPGERCRKTMDVASYASTVQRCEIRSGKDKLTSRKALLEKLVLGLAEPCTSHQNNNEPTSRHICLAGNHCVQTVKRQLILLLVHAFQELGRQLGVEQAGCYKVGLLRRPFGGATASWWHLLRLWGQRALRYCGVIEAWLGAPNAGNNQGINIV